MIARVFDPADPRLRDFVELRDVALRRKLESEEGLFLAEGAKTIARAVKAGYVPRSALLTEKWLPSVVDLLAGAKGPLLLADDDVLEQTTGFPVHRGALVSFERRPLPPLEDVLAGASSVAVLEDLVDDTNVGAVFRSAAALGVDAVLLTPRCGDPLYRRAVRTSMGAVFSVPWTRIDWHHGPAALKEAGFALVALTPDAHAQDIRMCDTTTYPRVAVVIGNEGQGSSSRWLDAADVRLRIPMAHGIDSLNVAAAAAVAFFALSRKLPGSE
ncbi:MAG: hypothetical protein QOI81_1313 [Actinomycetota bacterium]|jgi:tRNA G18 (ribose-2'-O)-methylase SpoU|nr:hypothetical protein [Actinomycetota bacterium]MEA2551664.1 hypothetical protein [Actinomycetota bacterium]